MLTMLALFGCIEPEVDDVVEATGPEVWGVAPAEDHDAANDVVEYHLTAAKTEIDWIEGGPTPIWAYNGQVPGPLIEATVGDTVRVVFENQLNEPTTIHWHGLRIDNAMDGVPAVQDPIEPGETFTYEFVVPDAGNFWYHPHVRGHEQVERGLYGPLVVHEAEPPNVDGDRYFVLDDVALRDNGKFYAFSTSGMDGMHGRHGNVLLTNGSAELLSDTIRPGAIERWRLVNTANARLMYANVKGADWRVVGVDGGIHETPYTTKKARLPVGRRFDLEVIPHDDAEKVELQVLIPANPGFDRIPVFEAAVEGTPVERDPVSWPGLTLPTQQTPTQELHVDLNVGGGMSLAWTINGKTYTEGDAIPVQGNTPTVIKVKELSGFAHPFHLHGQFFEVLSRNGGNPEIPGALDTIHVEGYDELELYTTFDNPGLWMAHCHILEHAELGMMTAFDVSD